MALFFSTDFGEWLQKVERDGRVSFVVMSGSKKVKGGKKQIFYCNRSGKFVSQGKNVRVMKSQGL